MTMRVRKSNYRPKDPKHLTSMGYEHLFQSIITDCSKVPCTEDAFTAINRDIVS